MDEKRKKIEFIFAILIFFWIFLSLFLLQTNFFGNLILTVIIVIILFVGLLLLAKMFHDQISEYPWLPQTEEGGDEPENHDCELILPYNETFDRCIQAIQMFRDIKIELSDKDHGKIKAIVPDRPFYNPESDLRQSDITITIQQKTKTRTQISVCCKRAFGSPPPYGMNKIIVEKICTFIQEPATMIDAEKENVSTY